MHGSAIAPRGVGPNGTRRVRIIRGTLAAYRVGGPVDGRARNSLRIEGLTHRLDRVCLVDELMTTPVRLAEPTTLPANGVDRRIPDIADGLQRRIDEILIRRPAVGLAVSVIRGGHAEFQARGLAHIATNAPITEDTVFRIGSITKLFTAIAVMQLGEQGLVDLDAPANDYLRAYQLIPAQAGWRSATLRHLLTHTAGIPEVRGVADLLHADFTPSGGRPAPLSVRAGEPMPSLAEYYREDLRIVVEPGTAFAYTNHGFATLGQIVEDVSDLPLDRYFRERIFEPLGMADSDLVRSERMASRLATGYVLARAGPRAVPDRVWIDAGAGEIYSTPRDMVRFAVALLGGGANEHGRILGAATLATMFEPHYQPDPRIPGMGLGFFRGDVGERRVVLHDGILPGFNSALLLAPDDGVGLIAFTNGSSGAFSWLQIELDRLLRQVLGVPDEIARTDVPHHPEIWPDLCGRYVFPPRIADLRVRLMLSGGAEVLVSGGRLKVRLLTPVPVPFRGLPLEPDDEHDPYAFRLDLSRFGMPSVRVVFSRGVGGRATAAHTDLGGQPLSLVRPDAGTKRRQLKKSLGAVAAVGLMAAVRRRRGCREGIGMALERLTALDRLMLGASRRWPQDIGAIAILDGGPLMDEDGRFRIEAVRAAVHGRLHLVPRFRQVIHAPRRGLGGPLWVDAQTFDLSRHVRELPLEPPVGEAQMLAAVEQLLRQRLDPSRPPWEMWFLTGLPDRRVGLFVRIHHTIADGMAAMSTIVALLDPAPDVPPAAEPRWRPAPRPSARALLADNLLGRVRALVGSLSVLARPRATARRLHASWPAIRELLAEEPASATSLDRMVGPDRRLALIRSHLNAVRAVGRAHDATVNDVLLAASAGGVRTLLQSRGEPVDDTTVRIYVPVSLRRRLRGPQQGNLIAQMAVPLHLGEADPVRRLDQIAAETKMRKARTRTNLGSLMVGGGIVRRLLLMAVMRQRVNVTSASIPGPKVPLYLAGARVLEVFPVLPLIANEPLGVGALSYAGTLTIGIAADRDAYPDLDVLAAAMHDALRSLGLPTHAALCGDAAAAIAPSIPSTSARHGCASRPPAGPIAHPTGSVSRRT
jgi:WS/DGAT/MGAT family acyltransferase